MKVALALVALVALLGVVIGERTLVVVDDLSVKDTHSTFFKSLTGIDRTPPSSPSLFSPHSPLHVQTVDMC